MSDSTKTTKLPTSLPVPKMRRGVKGFYRDIIREMKHVTWPSQAETTRLTGVVLAVCLLIVLLLMAAAFLLGNLIHLIVRGTV
jgi:preprotein translocase SecE subunit